MKISELLQRTPEKVDRDFTVLFGHGYCFVPEAQEYAGGGAWLLAEQESPRIEMRIFKEFHFDSRRFWRLAAVYLDGEPVMITQNAGREGDDFTRRFIIDRDRYFELVRAILAIPLRVEQPDEQLEDLCSGDEDLGDKLTSFYDSHLDQGHWERYHY
jgi:hypothetical protein